MKKIVILLVVVLLVLGAISFASSYDRVVQVKRVYDGDTFLAKTDNGKEKVRLLGIDCPESYANDKCRRDGRKGRKDCRWQIPRGKQAKAYAIKMLRGKTLSLECDGKCTPGHYNRLLRYVRLPDGSDFGLHLIEAGLCEDFSWKYPHPRQNQYRKAQKTAQKKKKGIWK